VHASILARVQRKAEYVAPTESIAAIAVDPSDNIFLDAAVEATADCLAIGDSHLLKFKSFRGIPSTCRSSKAALPYFGNGRVELDVV
jgi:predicted nucleic acid-binding protein